MHKTTIVGALQTLNFGILVFLVLVRLSCPSKLSRSAFFDCEKCKLFKSPILPNHTSPHYTTTQHLRPQIPKNLNRGPFTQTPKLILMSPQVLGGASNKKIHKIKRNISGTSSSSVIYKTPKFPTYI